MTDLNALTEAEYHRHPALSYSGAKILLQPGGPAKYRHMMDSPPVTKAAFDIGHAVHTLALGKGADIVLIDVDEYRTNDAKNQRDNAYEDGKTPLTRPQWAQVQRMHYAIERHPILGPLFARGDGIAEERLTWECPDTGVLWRGMIDWRVPRVAADLKTARSGEPHEFSRAMGNFSYHLQAAVTTQLIEDNYDEVVAFVNAVVEVDEPHLISVYQPDAEAIEEGRRMMRRASEIFRDCTESGVWPGYPTEVQTLSLPRYYQFTE